MPELLRGLAVLALLLLAGCAPQRQVRLQPDEPPAGRSPATSAAGPQGYTVVRGDTLYGIAFRHGLDYRELAQMNAIAAPYTIYPGQQLRVAKVAAPPVTSRSTLPAAAPNRGVLAPIARDAAPAAAPASPGKPTAADVGATAAVPGGTAPAAPPAAAGQTPAAPAAGSPPPAPAASLPAVKLTPGMPQWRWPAAGQMIGTFLAGDPIRQGINIAGQAGDPVHAAADGVVVYSGAGLIGYGELIIVKHNDTWLSAYGHNRKRLVSEGAPVRSGQAIAEMGRSGASRDMLHFEVRKNGRPVDPLGVLPRR